MKRVIKIVTLICLLATGYSYKITAKTSAFAGGDCHSRDSGVCVRPSGIVIENSIWLEETVDQ